MKRVKRNSGVWAYLNTKGVLDKGEDEIKKAKGDYRKQYLRNYKRERKGTKKEFSVTCNREEEQRLSHAAKAHGLTPNRFLKKAAFAYAAQAFVIPHIGTLHHIEQILLTCKSTMERIAEREPGAWFKQDRNYADLEKIITVVHKQIVETFAAPPALESVIQQALKDNPGYIETLKKIIAHYDSQKPFTQDSLIRSVTELPYKG